MAMKRLKGLLELSSTVVSTYAVATIFVPKTSAASVKHPSPVVVGASSLTPSNTQAWDNIFMECSTHPPEGIDEESRRSKGGGGGEVEMWVDMPGMEKEWIQVFVEDAKKRRIRFVAQAPKEEWAENEVFGKTYIGVFGLGCRCCHIKDFKHTVDNGLLRIVVSTTSTTANHNIKS